MPKTAYLSGPMAGHADLNYPIFQLAKEFMESLGFMVLLPHEVDPWVHDGDCPGGYRSSPKSPHAAACYLRTDLRAMLLVDQVVMLPEWETSVGARLELQVAAACGLPITFLPKEVILDTALVSDAVSRVQKWAIKETRDRQDCGHRKTSATGNHCTAAPCANYAGNFLAGYEEETRTPAEWSRVDGLTVMDPDGWRAAFAHADGKGYAPQSWDTPITRVEWEARVSVSSIIRDPRKKA